MNPIGPATVTATFEWGGRRITKQIVIPEERAKCFNPLPKDHDLPGNCAIKRNASIQREERWTEAQWAAGNLTHTIMMEIMKLDPINGYPLPTNETDTTTAGPETD